VPKEIGTCRVNLLVVGNENGLNGQSRLNGSHPLTPYRMMLTEDDSTEPEVDALYGEPQHETGGGPVEEWHRYGEPQHDVVEGGIPEEFDPDVVRALDWFGRPVSVWFRTSGD